MKWIDASVPLASGMVTWPGDPPVRIERAREIGHGSNANVSALSMGAHTGTHIDAPVHFREGALGVDRMPLELAVGRARVIAIHDPKAVDVPELRRHGIRRGQKLLFKTRNSARAWKAKRFVQDFVYLTTEAAQWLARRGVGLVGVDYLSVGGYQVKNGAAVHHALLDAGVWIIEGLDLSRVPPGPCELICLPLRIPGGDGSPARAIIRPLGRKEHRRG